MGEEIEYQKLETKTKTRSILRRFLIAAFLTQLLIAAVIFILSPKSFNGFQSKDDCFVDVGFVDPFDQSQSASDILMSLPEGAAIKDRVYNAWKTVRNSSEQHICQADTGVDPSGSNFVIKKFRIKESYVWFYYAHYDVGFVVPKGYQLTGAIAIDRSTDGTGAFCAIDQLDAITAVGMLSQYFRGINYVVLIIAKPSK